jgi:hypothetical protein
MDNYEYIVASLPVLRQEDVRAESLNAAGLVSEIRSQLSDRDQVLLDFLLDGYDPDKLDEGFYTRALAHRNRFLREWFAFDLDLRNTTVTYLNRQLKRDEDLDLIQLPGREEAEFPEKATAESILHGIDIMKRERNLDDLRWQKIDEITIQDFFDIEAILGFVAKLKIIDRWLQLDPESGRVLFRRMVEDIRSTYDNKKQDIAI